MEYADLCMGMRLGNVRYSCYLFTCLTAGARPGSSRGVRRGRPLFGCPPL